MSFATLARLSGIHAGSTPSGVMVLRGPFQQVQGRICTPWIQSVASVSKSKRFMSKGGTPEMTHEECVKMTKELYSTGRRLKRKMKFLDELNIMLIGLNGGAVVVVVGQHYSNVKETAKMAEELSKAQEDLKTGREILAKTLARIDALDEKLFPQIEGPATAGPATPSSR